MGALAGEEKTKPRKEKLFMRSELFQPDFFQRSAPTVDARDVAKFAEFLRGRGWRTTAELGAHSKSAKRRLRAIAQASKGAIISGNDGYALTVEASVHDIDHSIRRLRHAAKELEKRAQEIELFANQKCLV